MRLHQTQGIIFIVDTIVPGGRHIPNGSNHPSTIHETKERAEGLAVEVRKQLTDQEIEFARACSEDATLESTVEELLRWEIAVE